ncbi:hypothetical protein [Spirosoma luteum]|uniref:hypothetical protein n=1 Tax=Spirosoma luteum TaxID=431553 RepID=UPI0003A9C7EA|nr:hypothetical protein [Spirosoma luteum]
MTQAQINLTTFGAVIWCIAMLAGILFATLKNGNTYRLGIGGGMIGVGIGGIMIFRPELLPYAGMTRMIAVSLMLTFVLLSYLLGKELREDRQARKVIIWSVVGVVLIGVIAAPFVRLIEAIDMGQARAQVTSRAARRAETEVGRLQQQYAAQHRADSVQHVSDSLQIQRLQVKLTEQTAILKTTQNLIEKLEVLYKQLLLEVQRNRYEMRRFGENSRETMEPLAGKSYLTSETIDRIFSGPVGRFEPDSMPVSYKRGRR